MANHIVFDNTDILPPAPGSGVSNPMVRDEGNEHDVVGVAKYLKRDGIPAQELREFANPEYDTEGHFSAKQSELAQRQPKREK